MAAGEMKAIATVAVKDLQAAQRFYEGTLGLKETHREGDAAIEYTTGTSPVLVYQSEFGGTNRATSITWQVEDVQRFTEALREKGVRFEHYDMTGLERQGDVYVNDHMKVAWFKDPEGNILSVISS